MSKEEENKVLPKLRFAEFEDEGEWIVGEFSKFIVLYRGSSPRPIQDYFTKDILGVNWIKIGDTKSANNFIISQVEEKITPEGSQKSRKVNVGELILANSMSFGKTYQLAIDGFIYDGWFVLREYENFYNKQFLLQLLNSDYMQSQYTKFSAGGIVQNISSDIVYKTLLFHTTLPEQQKIADCLSSLDDLITAENGKLEALKAHKKGLMQQLFPAEGETVPKLRFAEFRESGEWEYSKIENYIDLLSGIPLKSEELSDDSSGFKILRGINITEGYVRHSKDMDKYFLGNIEAIRKYLVRENDLVIAMDGSKVGKNVSLIDAVDENSILIQRVARIRANKKTNIKYIYQNIFSEKFQNYVDKVNTSSGIPHISSQQIKDFEIGFPSLEEQQKIAECLSSLDEFITEQAQKIEALTQHKKGLMQGLFPGAADT